MFCKVQNTKRDMNGNVICTVKYQSKGEPSLRELHLYKVADEALAAETITQSPN